MHRSISGGKIIGQLSQNRTVGKQIAAEKSVQVLGKTLEMSTNLAASIAKNIIKKTIKKAIDTGIGY